MLETESNEKWFCSDCTALLGVRQGTAINIRFKQEINLTVEGKVILACRRCGTINQIDTRRKPSEKQ